MKIKWYGHSCFKFDFSNGPYIVTDPFDAHVGYPVCDAYADVVTTSHEHMDHNYIAEIKGFPTRISRAGLFTFDDLVVQGIKTYHDADGGIKRGENIVFIYESDNIRIAHMGDLGHEPNLSQYARLTNIDVLLIPIGGYYTIDTKTALKVIDHINPRVVIPMHFKTPVMNFPISDETEFAADKNAKHIDSDEIEITRENIDSLPRAVILKYPQ